jgi:3-oxoadipate enol-lactonase
MPFVELGELQTCYEMTGRERPVLVLSNSLGTNFSMWEPQMSQFDQRFRVLRYDTRGHGRSSVIPGDYSIEQLGRDVLGLLDALNLERVHFCGLSMGGMIGIWLGIHASERLDRLVLCNTAARIGTKEAWNARIETVRKNGMHPVASAVIERWFTPEFRATSPQRVAKAQSMLENSPPDGYMACCAAIRDMDQSDAVVRITTRTLVIHGRSDPVTPPGDAHFLVTQIRGSAGVELNAAHLSNVEQAEAFTDAVCSFLSR